MLEIHKFDLNHFSEFLQTDIQTPLTHNTTVLTTTTNGLTSLD